MSDRTFIDTHYLLALINPDDDWHDAAVKAASEIAGACLTTDAVLVELADTLCQRRHRAEAVRAVAELRADAAIECLAMDRALFDAAFELYRTRPDKDWSLTDCASFVAMKQHGITVALTADQHFEQAGFRAVLREKP